MYQDVIKVDMHSACRCSGCTEVRDFFCSIAGSDALTTSNQANIGLPKRQQVDSCCCGWQMSSSDAGQVAYDSATTFLCVSGMVARGFQLLLLHSTIYKFVIHGKVYDAEGLCSLLEELCKGTHRHC